MEYPDLISVQDNEVAAFKREILEKGKLERPSQPEMFRGAGQTLTGYINAIESALAKGIPNYPQYNLFFPIFLATFNRQCTGNGDTERPGHTIRSVHGFRVRASVHAHARTGRAINCYNCATCVGACPVKEAEGVQFPMGWSCSPDWRDYERVTELSKYCVDAADAQPNAHR